MAQDVVVRNYSLRRDLEADGRGGEAEVASHLNEPVKAWFYRNPDKPLPVNPTLGGSKVPAFAKVDGEFEMRWHRSQRDNQRLCKGPTQRVEAANQEPPRFPDFPGFSETGI